MGYKSRLKTKNYNFKKDFNIIKSPIIGIFFVFYFLYWDYWMRLRLSYLKTNRYSMRIRQTLYNIRLYIFRTYSKSHYLDNPSLSLRVTSLYTYNSSPNVMLLWLKLITLDSDTTCWIRLWPSHLKTN